MNDPRADDEATSQPAVSGFEPDHDAELASSDLPFPVVGIGASAGGLAALARFFEGMPAHCGMAFVVVLHLSPKHESSVAAILQRSTRMPVQEVVGTTPVLAGHVYVIPPGRHLAMDDGHLRHAPSKPAHGRHIAIDLFFRTLAQVHEQRAVAIVLSGTGNDGADGVTRVKVQGGITFAQRPDDAEYGEMPAAAIATDSVDFVLPVIEMPQRLLDLVGSARLIRLPPPRLAPTVPPALDASDAAEAALAEIRTIVRKHTGHDFTHYKRATILRRLERRLQVNALRDLPAYQALLAEHPDEVRALLQDLLIGVTNFFRDREAFEALEREALPPLIAGRSPGEPLRVWVVGVASGEEAYSIAMQLSDLADSRGQAPQFQIFATDIDERALAVARAGRYPRSIVADVPAARLRRYLVRDGDHYRIAKNLRDRVLFARHNVLHEPAFSRIDLVSCRNLLIYLERAAQKQALDTFRFALGTTGTLFLGTSESVEAAGSAFRAFDQKHRIFRSNPFAGNSRALPAILQPLTSTPAVASPPPADPAKERFATLHRQAIESFASPSVLIDAQHQILHLSNGAGRFLEHAGGVPSHHLVTIIHPELRLELRTALFKASQNGKAVEARAVRMHRDGRDVFVHITVRPWKSNDLDLVVVSFDEVEETMRQTADGHAGRQGGVVEELEAELKREREHLQVSLERSETSTQELKASNEELQAINEELRSTSEEFETGKEELQSVNEELIAVNHELKTKIDEAGKINDDLQNLIASTDIATIFVDHGLRIKRYTPRAIDLFHLIPSDVGRSLLDIRHSLRYDELGDDAATVFRSLRPIEREVESESGHCYLARLLPYRTTADLIDGATITFVDVTNLRHAETRAREGEAHLRLAAATTKDFAIMTMDESGVVTTWNSGAERIFGYAPDEIVGRSARVLFVPEDRAAGVPEKEVATALSTGRAEDDRWHLRKDGTRFFCSGVVTPFESGELKGLAKIARDITGTRREQTVRDAMLSEERAARAQYEAASRLKDEFLAVVSHELKHPLNLIHVNAELLSRLPQLRDVPTAARAADVIRKTVVGQGKIIDDLLDLSRSRTGKLTLQLAPLDLAATIDGIVTAVRADAEARRIALTYDAEHGLAAVAGDTVRIEQIVWNLLSNALKFTPEGGRIDVRIDADAGYARLAVTDSGKGISAAFLPRVFDLFGQESNGSARSGGGLGIGLAVARELATAMGGRIEARSDGVDRGATFTVWLPFHDSGSGRSESPTTPTRALAGLRILVVEDSREALEPFVELLRLDGALPEAATDGRDALRMLDDHDFDLIISDIGMPDLNGYEFLAGVRRHPRAAAVAAIALTGYGRGRDRQHAIEAGFDAHVTKPASLHDLRLVLESLGPRRSLRP